MPVLQHKNSVMLETALWRMARARAETDQLFALVKPEALYQRPLPERHRINFYLGHLEAFDWNLLRPHLTGAQVFDKSLDQLFAFGIDPIDGQLPADQPSDWPSIEQTYAHRDRIRQQLEQALTGQSAPELLLNVAIEHRLMHAETLAYILHQLPYGEKGRQAQTPIAGESQLHSRMIEIPAGSVTLGLNRDKAFGWDNEFEAHTVHVDAFALDQHKITNGQYLAFVQADGYQEKSLWSTAACGWKQLRGLQHPVFWKRAGRAGMDWLYRGMFEEIPLPLLAPVYVSHAEASAYARWAGKRLPTEAEWQRAAYAEGDRAFPWGNEAPDARHGYFDLARWDAYAVNAAPGNRSPFGVEGLLANGWEWTSSIFAPFPGFQAFPFYKGYSADFFDGFHYVMKGGSPRTEACMLRRSFRNWFQPHYEFVYAGFRLASL